LSLLASRHQSRATNSRKQKRPAEIQPGIFDRSPGRFSLSPVKSANFGQRNGSEALCGRASP
jgi:hypothetical protein